MALKEYLDCSSTNIGANSWFDLSKSDYAKVIFSDLYHSPDSSVGCRFQITDNVHEDPCDYVGIFKVGYENLTQCLVSKMLSETECEEDGKQLRCTFRGHELPKLEPGFYQFLYVTRDNEVCGASLPFEIKQSLPKEIPDLSDSSDEDVVADKTEDDFLVVRSTIAEQNRNLQDLVNKMNQKSMDQEKFYSSCVTKLSKEKLQLEKELKRVRDERDLLSEECRKIMEEKNIICKDNDATIQNLEQQIIGLASKIEVAYDKFRGLEKVKDALEKDKNQALEDKEKMEISCDQLMKDLDLKIVAVHKLQQELKHRHEQEIKHTAEMENISVLESQLEDTRLMISALEESKQLVMNEVTQLTECNKELKDTLKELRCENFALKLQLKDAEILNEKIKRRNQNLKKEVATLKFNNAEGQNLEALTAKVQNTSAVPEKMYELKLGAATGKIRLDQECRGNVEEESFKSQLDKLKNELLEKEAIISKLKEDCLKKDAVVEYLSKEKDNVHKTSAVMEDALNDSVLRLKDAAEIYKKQYLEIEKLKKKLEKTRSKCKQRYSSEGSSIRDELTSLGIKDTVIEGTKPPQNRSSDSDTGEHVLGHTLEMKKQALQAVRVAHEESLQSSSSSDELAGDKKTPDVSDKKFKDLFGQSLDISYLNVASTSNQTPSKSRQSPELQSMIDQNLAKLSLSKSKEEEQVMYSIPCPICDVDIGIYTESSEEMIKHLEIQHKQQICPICDKLFDMTLPQKYFQYHVEDHFRNSKK